MTKKGWIISDEVRILISIALSLLDGKTSYDIKQIKCWKSFKRHAKQIKIHCQPSDLTERYKTSWNLFSFIKRRINHRA